MKRKIFSRAIAGAPIGLTICIIITIIFSLNFGEGSYIPASHELIDSCKNELSAVILQTALSLLYGAFWGGASVIWDTNWSLAKMTAVHFAICVIPSAVISCVLRWVPSNIVGALRYIAGFLTIYIAIWLYNWFKEKHRVNELNKKLRAICTDADTSTSK